MGLRRHDTPPSGRDDSRPRRPHTRVPSRRPRRRPVDPALWLKATIVLAGAGLVVLPLVADGVTAAFGPTNGTGCRVVSVIDGDTVRMWCQPRGLFTARLAGFDTPEVFSPHCAAELAKGTAATWALRRILWSGEVLSLTYFGPDRYGREIVGLAIDGRPVADRMISEGHARPYDGGPRQGWCS